MELYTINFKGGVAASLIAKNILSELYLG